MIEVERRIAARFPSKEVRKVPFTFTRSIIERKVSSLFVHQKD